MATAATLQPAAPHALLQPTAAETTHQKSNDSSFIPRGPATAVLKFFDPPQDGSVPFNFVEKQPEGQPQSNLRTFETAVTIHDIRGGESKYTLDRDAFAVVSNVPESAEREFADDESIKKNYYPEVEKLILDHVPGSNRVVIFDHTIRRSHPDSHRKPVSRVHIDQTSKSAAERVRLHLPDEAEKLLRGRYRIINIWRPLNGPVQASPLAFASSSTVRNEDVTPVEHRYPHRTGETAGVSYNKDQKWYYLSGTLNNERIFLECFDSEALKPDTKVQGGRVPHTAFEDSRTPVGAPGRESIEVRALVFGP